MIDEILKLIDKLLLIYFINSDQIFMMAQWG